MPRLKNEVVHLRMTTEEKETLKALAAKKRMTQSEYVRYIIHRESVTL